MKPRKDHIVIAACILLLLILLLGPASELRLVRRIFAPVLFLIGLFYALRLLPIGSFRRNAEGHWPSRRGEDFGERIGEDGIFTYTSDGFSFPYHGDQKSVRWSDIRALLAYKDDKLTYDLISLLILFNGDQKFLINEDTAGWHRFTTQLSAQLPVAKDWLAAIGRKAFVRTETVVFDRDGVGTKAIMKEVYGK